MSLPGGIVGISVSLRSKAPLMEGLEMVACRELSALSLIVDVDDEGRGNLEGVGLGREVTCALIDCETSVSVSSAPAAVSGSVSGSVSSKYDSVVRGGRSILALLNAANPLILAAFFCSSVNCRRAFSYSWTYMTDYRCSFIDHV